MRKLTIEETINQYCKELQCNTICISSLAHSMLDCSKIEVNIVISKDIMDRKQEDGTILSDIYFLDPRQLAANEDSSNFATCRVLGKTG